jgi:hypothetical protein
VNYSKTVLWLGLILIALNLAKNWATLKSTIFTPDTTTGNTSSSSSSLSPSGIFSQYLNDQNWLFQHGLGGLTSETEPSTPAATPDEVAV